jgi:hypothetical protein
MKNEIIPQGHIENKIFTIRGVQVMLDSDLAVLYQTETKFINRAVKRNPLRFPEVFAFQIDDEEWNYLRFQIGTLNNDSDTFESIYETSCFATIHD